MNLSIKSLADRDSNISANEKHTKSQSFAPELNLKQESSDTFLKVKNTKDQLKKRHMRINSAIPKSISSQVDRSRSSSNRHLKQKIDAARARSDIPGSTKNSTTNKSHSKVLKSNQFIPARTKDINFTKMMQDSMNKSTSAADNSNPTRRAGDKQSHKYVENDKYDKQCTNKAIMEEKQRLKGLKL